MPAWAEQLMVGLVAFQNRYPRSETVVKPLRGLISWLPRCLPDSGTLAPELASVASAGVAHRRHEAACLAERAPSRERRDDIIRRMMTWLGANDEATKEKRFGEWHTYFTARGIPFAQTAISRCLELAEEFAGTSREALGKYTENVKHFLEKEASNFRRRYDARLLSSTQLEYHLGMLGTEILNRDFRQRFLETRHKMVILLRACVPLKRNARLSNSFRNQMPGLHTVVSSQPDHQAGRKTWIRRDHHSGRCKSLRFRQAGWKYRTGRRLVRPDQLERRLGHRHAGNPRPRPVA